MRETIPFCRRSSAFDVEYSNNWLLFSRAVNEQVTKAIIIMATKWKWLSFSYIFPRVRIYRNAIRSILMKFKQRFDRILIIPQNVSVRASRTIQFDRYFSVFSCLDIYTHSFLISVRRKNKYWFFRWIFALLCLKEIQLRKAKKIRKSHKTTRGRSFVLFPFIFFCHLFFHGEWTKITTKSVAKKWRMMKKEHEKSQRTDQREVERNAIWNGCTNDTM